MVRKASNEIRALIKSYEGYRSESYECAAGIWTIGYGTTANVTPDLVINEYIAKILFDHDLRAFEAGVSKLIPDWVSDRCFDAYVSLAYNIGLGALEESTSLARLTAKDWKGAAGAFQWFNKGGGATLAGLEKRRKAEVDWWLSGELVLND